MSSMLLWTRNIGRHRHVGITKMGNRLLLSRSSRSAIGGSGITQTAVTGITPMCATPSSSTMHLFSTQNHNSDEKKEDTTTRSKKRQQKVCLLTLKPTASFYEQFGFKIIASDDELQQLPSSLRNEYLAGSAISLILGNSIICMVET